MSRGRGRRRRALMLSVAGVYECAPHGLTSDDLRALEVLVGVQVARRQGKVDAHEDQEEVDSPPHGVCCAPFECLEEIGRAHV